ncbi:MAG: hydrogenase iron-sulfur subunit [Thermodesulfobacteriota bacterium]|nr:hydrogenase iron-sulfur subunit [Thermodesulfobacteriota bacterium]
MNEFIEPEILVLYCGHSLVKGEYLSEGTIKGSGFRARFIMMPCSSKVETGYLLKLILQGVDGIVIVACPEKQCKFMIGSSRAESRITYTRNLLSEVNMGEDRVCLVRMHNLSADQIVTIAEKQANVVRHLGINPLKTKKGCAS